MQQFSLEGDLLYVTLKQRYATRINLYSAKLWSKTKRVSKHLLKEFYNE